MLPLQTEQILLGIAGGSALRWSGTGYRYPPRHSHCAASSAHRHTGSGRSYEPRMAWLCASARLPGSRVAGPLAGRTFVCADCLGFLCCGLDARHWYAVGLATRMD